MNERIRKLVVQSEIQFHNLSTGNGDNWQFTGKPEDLEKFAELIVKECAKIAHRHTPDYEELEYSHLIKDKILQHFGVK